VAPIRSIGVARSAISTTEKSFNEGRVNAIARVGTFTNVFPAVKIADATPILRIGCYEKAASSWFNGVLRNVH